MPQLISTNLDFDYDSIQPNPKEVTSVTSSIEQSTMSIKTKEDDFITYSSTSNRPSMSTSKVTSDSNMIRTTQVTESTEFDRKPTENESNVEPSLTKAKDKVIGLTLTKTKDSVPAQQSENSVPEHTESSVEPMVTTKAEESTPTEQSVASVPGQEESSVGPMVTIGEVLVSTEKSFKTSTTKSEQKANPTIEPLELTNVIAPVTTTIEDTKPPNSANSSYFNINPSLINETTEQSRSKSCFPDLNLADVHNFNVTNSATGFESPKENNQETITIRLCGSYDNLNDIKNNKRMENEEHVVDDNPEKHPTTTPNQSITTIEDTISPTSTESTIQSELSKVTDPTSSAEEMPSVSVEKTTIIKEASQPSTSERNQLIETTSIISQQNNFETISQLDTNGSSAAIETTTIIDETMPHKMSEINEFKETTTIISQTTVGPEVTTQHDLKSNGPILTSYHVLEHSIVLCVIIFFQQSSYCI